MSLLPFFEESWQAWGAGLIITTLIGVSGGLRLFVLFVIELATLFGFLASIQGIITMVISIIILLALLIFFGRVIRDLKEKAMLEVAESQGMKTGARMGIFNKIAKYLAEKNK
jgi:membrane protein required for beta-lactamase induction